MAEPLLMIRGNAAAVVAEAVKPAQVEWYPGDGQPEGYKVPSSVWPHVRGFDDGGSFSAGPTGEPWIDANGWRIRVARLTQTSARRVWLGYEFPPGLAVFPERYLLAVAEARAYGAHWLVAPDARLREATARNDVAARAAWRRIGAAHQLFARHPDWSEFREEAQVVAVSDFAPPERALAMETVNMSARRQLSCRLLRPAGVSETALGDAAAVLWLDRKPVADAVIRFVKAGGLLLMSSAGPQVAGTAAMAGDAHPRMQVLALGKGRVAVSRRPWTDPFLIALDAQLLASKRSEVLKLWNGASVLAFYARSEDGKRGLVHLLNYSARAGDDPVSLRVEHRYASARLHTFEADAPVELALERAGEGVEFGLPRFSAYAGVELAD